jgi:hypothetical protein
MLLRAVQYRTTLVAMLIIYSDYKTIQWALRDKFERNGQIDTVS